MSEIDVVDRLRYLIDLKFHDTPTIREAVKEIERLRAWKADVEETHRSIVNEECAPDEKHCTCVPAMRQEIERLRKELCDYELASIGEKFVEGMSLCSHGLPAHVCGKCFPRKDQPTGNPPC